MAALSLRTRLLVAGSVAAGLWGVGVIAWLFSHSLAPLIFFGYLGTVVAPGVTYYLGLSPGKRIAGRRPLVAAIGLGMLAAALARVLAQQSIVAVEGLFFELFSGIFGAALLHFVIAKLIGPLIFGRVYCGWACWTGALLDLLPFRHSEGRRGGIWPWLRYIHLAVSLALVAGLWFSYSYLPGPFEALIWFLSGVALYYLLGVTLALVLHDNRAFCKYLCPAGVLALPAARFSLLKVRGDPQKCNALGECVAACPMDIRITDYTHHGVRVLSSECTLCQVCINACPDGSLALSVGVDPLGRLELLRTYAGPAPVTIIPRRLRRSRQARQATKLEGTHDGRERS
ncbi:MAG: 4Fe-4S binding protein [Chloroflexi bacterium]|nr:4Fe-4S binding protein [Chloroflexota bacterium]